VATVHKRASAKRDLIEQYVYLGEHADFETAERFLANADASFTDLSRNPGMGAPRSLRSPKLAGLHKWRVSGFEKFLIFLSAPPGRRFGLVDPSWNSMSSELTPYPPDSSWQ
jgi:plasmid stabilization system protein ParE